jgi:hypothetical protein
MITGKTDGELCQRISAADRRYGPFSSTHEALGVCSEEWLELQVAIKSNDFEAIQTRH